MDLFQTADVGPETDRRPANRGVFLLDKPVNVLYHLRSQICHEQSCI